MQHSVRALRHASAAVKALPDNGLDTGLTRVATLADGKSFAPAKPLKAALPRLKTEQRKMSRQFEARKHEFTAHCAEFKRLGLHGPLPLSQHVPLSNRLQRQIRRVAILHTKVELVRRDSLRKLVRQLEQQYRLMAVEEHGIEFMKRNRRTSRSVSDVAPGLFKQMLQVPKRAILSPPAKDGQPLLELRLVPSVVPTPVGLSFGLNTQAILKGESTAADAFKAIRELSIFISLCLGERFEFDKVFSLEAATGGIAAIAVVAPALPKRPYFHYAPVSIAALQCDPSPFARFKALCTVNIELVTELYERLLTPKTVGETDVLRQVAMTEGLARLALGENGAPVLLANKAQLELWKRKHSKTLKGYSETGLTIRRAVDHLPPELAAVAQRALQCSSGANERTWAERFERLVQNRHTVSHFLHSLPVGYAPTGDEFFRDWHASNMLAYVLCMGFLGFDDAGHKRVATLEAWKRPSRAGDTPTST